MTKIIVTENGIETVHRVKNKPAESLSRYSVGGKQTAVLAEHNGKTIRINIFCTPDTASKSDSVVGQVLDTIAEQTIYWSDTRLCHWSYDYKLACGVWCENIEYSDSLKKVECTVCL